MTLPLTEPRTPGQEDDAWVQARLGKLTASRFSEAIAKTKAGWSTSRRKLMIELMAERFTGMRADPYMNAAMQWGTETEPFARKAYEAKTGETVTKTPFVDHPRIPMCGASPDGLAGYQGLVEIKCPETRTHLSYMIDRVIPDNYQVQMQWQLAVTGRAWCDFASFDPRMPPALRLFVVRVKRDAALIKNLEKMAIEFLSEMAFAIEAIEGGHVESSDI